MEASHAQMNDAARAGAAVPLGPGLPWVVRYLGAWWVEYEDGWLRVTDEHVAADLDGVAARLGEAVTVAEADEARYRSESDPDATGGGRELPKTRAKPLVPTELRWSIEA
jgi:hypothetical protein